MFSPPLREDVTTPDYLMDLLAKGKNSIRLRPEHSALLEEKPVFFIRPNGILSYSLPNFDQKFSEVSFRLVFHQARRENNVAICKAA